MSDVDMSLTRVLRGGNWEVQVDRVRLELHERLNQRAESRNLVVRPPTSDGAGELLRVDESGRWATLTVSVTASGAPGR